MKHVPASQRLPVVAPYSLPFNGKARTWSHSLLASTLGLKQGKYTKSIGTRVLTGYHQELSSFGGFARANDLLRSLRIEGS